MATAAVASVPDAFKDELHRLSDLEPIGLALAKFALSLSPGNEFEKQGRRWVLRPDNFVAFTVQFARTKSIRLSLRTSAFALTGSSIRHTQDLELRPRREGNSYAECVVDSPLQLDTASSYIAEAYEILREMGGRPRRA